MNIFFLTETESGCFKWRSAIPAKYLRQRGHTVQIFSDEVASYDTPDVMVFFRAHYPNIEKLVEFCKRKSIRIVFDTDDALDLIPRGNVNYRGMKERLGLYDYLIEQADAVTTTTPILAADLCERNPNVVVLPNSLDPEEWEVLPRTSGARIGWNGSATHFSDLSVALGAVRDLQKKRDFTFVLQGICEDTSVYEFYDRLVTVHGKAFSQTPFGKSIKRFLGELTGIRHEFYPVVPLTEHPQRVCELALDIGIAPLVEDSFNQNKSCIKYYEYAMSGAVTVASRVLPYSTEVPITAKNSRESWKLTLEQVLDADRAKLAREQREWVLEYRNIERNVELWERCYQGDLVTSSTQPAQSLQLAETLASVPRL